MKIMTPALALGQAVHEVIEELSRIPLADRFSTLLMDRYERIWQNISGKRGGFLDDTTEDAYKRKGRDMIARITKHPGPLAAKAVKIKESLPFYWLSEEDNIILCGKVDWLEYLPEGDSVHIIDFKTSKYDEDPNSLQLPIYYLLVTNTQIRPVAKASYWYLSRSDQLSEQVLPDEKTAHDRVLDVARGVKTARKLGRFICPQNGCRACAPYESVLAGKGELIGVDTYQTDVYILPEPRTEQEKGADVL